ncbi:MAG: flagellar basal body protein FliL [Alphaproteobacteria bacterium]|nr:flagellar basal body protein FliL [Alphaproteobacteria bacterium]
MAEEERDDEAPEEREEAGEGEGDAQTPQGRKRLLILVVLAVLLVVGGVAGAYFMGLMDPLIAKLTGREIKATAAVGTKDAVFMELPELLVNLNTGGRRSAFLKMKVSIEVDKREQIPAIEKLMPRVVDNFQIYLRELRIEDLRGSAGMYRLREELLIRINAAVAPAKVDDVLFKELLIQ